MKSIEERAIKMQFKKNCIGIPLKDFAGLGQSCERQAKISARKSEWIIKFYGIYSN